ncbi:hypothetical protein [Sphaerisporangium sp. TRM90804]|uniref:hypothetical protein n=1 Tax=Sphaerisporangium sp. TRM90804 TaxID=3031113 RepID=UPI002448FB1C|nr:hypothetical protein [Sphaerisporangium sp. TRM90804]MDH2424773.1 hypothetical protein [Sphaerisporangium sp. TRM90804]
MRIQILPLPSNVVGELVEEPFALIVDECDELGEGGVTAWSRFKDECGARAIVFTAETVEVVDRYAPEPKTEPPPVQIMHDGSDVCAAQMAAILSQPVKRRAYL